MRCRVVFVNPLVVRRGDSFRVEGPTYVAALARATLRSYGIECLLPMESPAWGASAHAALTEAMERTAACCRPDAVNVVGLSNWASTALASAVMAHNLRLLCASRGLPVLIVAGGPLFTPVDPVETGGGPCGPIEAALKWRADDGSPSPYDGVVCGGLSALVALVKAVEADALKAVDGRLVPTSPPPGYYHRDGNAIEGRGRSARARTDVPPICVAGQPGEAGYDLVLMTSSCCPNGCGYCSIGERHRFDPAGIRRACEQLDPGLRRPDFVKLLDPNPFAEQNAPHSARCLEAIHSVLGYAPRLHCFYDSSAFRAPDRLLAELDRHNAERVFIGREAIGEPGLSFIGRRLRRRLRTPAMIAQERAGLEEVVRKRRERGKALRLAVAYIVSPPQTPASLREVLDDMDRLVALSGDEVSVQVQWELLWPNPGTDVFAAHRSLIAAEPYFETRPDRVWRREAVAARYPSAVLGRTSAETWDSVTPDRDGLKRLIDSVER